MVKRVGVQMLGQGMGLEVTEAAKIHLADKGYDPTLGARPLRRAIQRLVEDPLSERLLYKEFRAGQVVVVDLMPDPEKEGENILSFTAHDGFVPPASPEEELAATAASAAPAVADLPPLD